MGFFLAYLIYGVMLIFSFWSLTEMGFFRWAWERSSGMFFGNVLRECSSGMFFGNVLQECSSRMFSAIFVLRPFLLRRVYFRHARTPGGIPDITDVCNVLALTKIFCVARFIRSVQKTSRFASSPDFHARSTRWSVALCAVCDPCGDSSLTASLGGAHQVGKNGPPEHRELECGSLGSAQARRRASSDRTTSRVGLGERAERRAGS